MKKQSLITILLTVLMSMVGAKAFAYDIAVENADGVTIYYNYSSDATELKVAQASSSYAYRGAVVIPEEVTYMNRTRKVTSIGNNAFYNCSDLTSVTIPNSVTSIGSEAFSHCKGLTSVTIPNSVTSIGNHAFLLCSGLTSVTIGDNVTSIGMTAFGGCSGLTSVTIGNSVRTIGSSAFSECSGLTSVTIGNSVRTIGSSAFDYCRGLTSVYISDIEAWCNIQFENQYANPLIYAHHLYLGEEEIKDLVIPNSVTSIGNYAFYNCSGLTSVTIPNSVISIGGDAFNGADIPTIISEIRDLFPISSSVFSKNTFINATLYVPAGTKYKYNTTDGWKNFKFIEEAGGGDGGYCGDNVYYSYDKTTHKLTISGEGPMWSGYDVIFPWESNDDDIQYVNIELGVTSIGEYAFCDFRSLTSVTIPNSVTSIGEGAFMSCSSLTSITIPNSVTSIGSEAFEDCSGLTSILVESDNQIYDSRNNCNAIIETSSNSLIAGCMNTIIPNSVTSIDEYAFHGCSGLTSMTIPNSVTSIGKGAFMSCSSLTSVTIPNNVISIGDYAFRYCSGLTSITIGSSVTSIGSEAFEDCSGLTSILVESDNLNYDSRNNCNAIIETSSNSLIAGCMNTIIPNSVTSIEKHAFYGCSGLTSITIPNNVTSIGDYAFDYCSGLTSILVESDNQIYDSRNNCNAIIETSSNSLIAGCMNTIIPNSVTLIDKHAFYGCSGLTSVTIPNSETEIGWAAFSRCSGLTSITIPNSVTSIGYYAFDYCNGLTSVTIPNSVTFIGNCAFGFCSGLKDYYVWAENVPLSYASPFRRSSDIEKATLHVPAASVEIYKRTDPWSGFGRIVPLTDKDPTSMKGIMQSDNLNGEYYDLNGRKVHNPQKGLYIRDGKKVVVK